jgi:ZIP family zinc transporter/zinc and cadmium transporter
VTSSATTLLFATLAGLGSVVGMAFVLWKEAFVRRWSVPAVALAAGAMATTAISHLFPEALEGDAGAAPLWVLAGFAAFFLLNQVVSFHACGSGLTHLHPVGTMALVGILVHSFFDGVAVAAGFGAGGDTGRVVSAAVFTHELPEGAFTVAILLHTGMTRRRAAAWGVVHGLLTPIGALTVAPLAAGLGSGTLAALLGLSAGSFLYVASANLVPEAHRETSRRNALAFLGGIALVLGLSAASRAAGLGHGAGDHAREGAAAPR